jgi:hypothetical protein
MQEIVICSKAEQIKASILTIPYHLTKEYSPFGKSRVRYMNMLVKVAKRNMEIESGWQEIEMFLRNPSAGLIAGFPIPSFR